MGSEWKKFRLDEVTDLIVDCPHSTPKWTDSGVLVLRSQFIKGGRLNLSNPSFTDEEGYQARIKRAVPSAGDIVLTREAPMGEVCMIPENLKCCLGQRMVLLRAKSDILDSTYLLYTLQSPFLQHQISWNEGTGTTVSNIRIPSIKAFEIPTPDLFVQKKIAHILGSIDQKIQLNCETNKTLEAMAQALFKSWFVDFDPVIDNALAAGNDIPEPLQARAAARKARAAENSSASTVAQNNPTALAGLPKAQRELFPSEFEESEELGWVPKGWGVEKAEKVSSVAIGKTPPRKQSEWFSRMRENNITWVSIRDMGGASTYISYSSEYLTQEAVEKFNVKVTPKDSILLSFKLTLGRVAIAACDMATNEAIAHFSNLKYGLNKEYLYCYLNGFNYPLLGSTSSIATAVNSKIIKAMPIMVPTNEILNEFKCLSQEWFLKTLLVNTENDSLIDLRDTLLPKLISGELRLPDAEKQLEALAK